MTSTKSQQSGAVLIVALVILAVATLLGVSVMQSATVETKMATNTQERAEALFAAEATLKYVEQEVIPTITHADLSSSATCTPSINTTCFNPACTTGLCFGGTWDGNKQSECEFVPAGGVTGIQIWENSTLNVWNDNTKHKVHPGGLPGYGATPPGKFIIEFRCFVDQIDDGSGTAGTVADNGGSGAGDVLYRITTRGTSRNSKLDAMVQSTFRAPKPPTVP